MDMKKLWIAIFLLFILLILLFSCGSPRQPAPEKASADTVSVLIPATGAGSPVLDSTLEERQTMASPEPERIVIRKYGSAPKTDGSVVYYCPRRMLESTDNNVSVTITKVALAKALANLERRISESSGVPAVEIREGTGGSNLTISRRMKVELKFAEDDFQTIYKPENDDQIFDGEQDMNWDWIIRPKNVGSAQLSIIVSAFDEINNRWMAAQTPPKIFDIQVQVDPRGYFSKLWGFLGANPEWLLTQLLFPLIAFFYGKRQKSKTT